MNKKYIPILSFFLLLFVFGAPLIVFADPCTGTGSVSGLVPSDACIKYNGFEALALMANTIINWFITIAGSVAAVVFAWGGAQMLLHPESPSELEKAKKMLINTAVGMAIVLCAWLVVHTVIGTLVNSKTCALRFLGDSCNN